MTIRQVLLNPGPVTTADAVKQALLVPDICHRETAFTDLIKTIREDLVTVAQGDDSYTSVLFGASGTGALEACITSVIPAAKKILVVNNGTYGARLLAIAERYGIDTVAYELPFDRPLDLSVIEQHLAHDPEIAAVALVHHETSSGILNPLTPVGALCQRYGRYFIVDAMSSFGGCDIDVRRDHIDFIISSSNKCLHGMPGIAFVVAKTPALLATAGAARSYYFDLHQQYHALENTGQLPFTPPVQIAYAFKAALDAFFEETLAGRIARYQARYAQLLAGLEAQGFTCLTPASMASHLLMTVRYPDNDFDFEALHDTLFAQGFTIYPKKLAIPQTFRLACLGEITEDDIIAFLAALSAYRQTRLNQTTEAGHVG